MEKEEFKGLNKKKWLVNGGIFLGKMEKKREKRPLMTKNEESPQKPEGGAPIWDSKRADAFMSPWKPL